MDEINGVQEFVSLFKERENIPFMGAKIGRVISPPPNIIVKLGSRVTLTKKNIVIAARLLPYPREFQSQSTGNIITKTPPPESYDPATVVESQDQNGTIDFTDQFLKAGDEVMLIPTMNEQIYFLIDKAVSL